MRWIWQWQIAASLDAPLRLFARFIATATKDVHNGANASDRGLERYPSELYGRRFHRGKVDVAGRRVFKASSLE